MGRALQGRRDQAIVAKFGFKMVAGPRYGRQMMAQIDRGSGGAADAWRPEPPGC